MISHFNSLARSAAADERLGHLRHRDRGRHASLRAAPLQRVPQGDGVDDRGQHPHVVARDAVDALGGRRHAAKDVPAADDDGDLNTRAMDLDDLVGHAGDGVRIDGVPAPAHERFPGKFEKDTFVTRRHSRRFIQ